MRGEAYLALRQYGAAAFEFDKLLSHPGVVLADPAGAVARLQMARAVALAGDNGKAKTAYEDFLTLWKNADPNVAILKEAKAEYRKVQ